MFSHYRTFCVFGKNINLEEYLSYFDLGFAL